MQALTFIMRSFSIVEYKGPYKTTISAGVIYLFIHSFIHSFVGSLFGCSVFCIYCVYVCAVVWFGAYCERHVTVCMEIQQHTATFVYLF